MLHHRRILGSLTPRVGRTGRKGICRSSVPDLELERPPARCPGVASVYKSEGYVLAHVLGRRPVVNRHTTRQWLHAGNYVPV